MGRRDRDSATALRAVLLVLCAVLDLVAGPRTSTLVIALLGCLALAGVRSRPARDHPLRLALLEAALVGAGVVLTGGAQSALLPYLLVPPSVVALSHGARGVVLASGTAAGSLLLTRVGQPALAGTSVPEPWSVLAAATAEWALIALALGLLVARAAVQLRVETDAGQQEYGEARTLLTQLRSVSRRLPGGLDVTSSADALLAQCAELAPTFRSAVLVQPSGGPFVPVAVRGTRRVPWQAPLDAPGPLRDAWERRAAAVDRRPPDQGGRRRGSALLAAPLLVDGVPFGLVVLESSDLEAFPAPVVQAVEARVRAAGLPLETALLFAEVRSSVTVQERDRLAREIHDGIAQDLAAVGYGLDDLRLRAARLDGGLAGHVAEVRAALTHLISDLRLSITDLRTSVASDRGLGSALSSYVRAVGSGQSLRVHLSLQESAFRLPAEHEVLLLQLVQAVAQDVRRRRQADNLWVDLVVDPPHARLVVEHDGAGPGDPDLSALVHAVGLAGGSVSVEATPAGGRRVTALLEGGTDGDHRPAGR